MSSQHYVAQAQAFTQLAASALSASEREGYLNIAAGYATLATDAARFEARFGALSAKVADQASVTVPDRT